MIDEKDIQAPALKALEILKSNNAEAYIVGGAVRDIIMGKTPKDFDITTVAPPPSTLDFFSDYKTFETGIRYGTVTVIIDNLPIEITTFRTDGEYIDNRKPESVAYTKKLTDDLSRRDFTINALAYSPSEGLIDLFDGTGDIKRKLIRAINNPDERFKEDALRILRALRFASTLGFEIEEKTKKAVFDNKELLKNISKERIRVEFNKILTGMNAAKVLSEYRDVVAVFIPEIIPSFDFDQKSMHHSLDVYSHILAALDSSENDLKVRLAVFFHDLAKPLCFVTDENGIRHYKGHPDMGAELAAGVLRRLKYDNKTIKEVPLLIKYHDTKIAPSKPEVKKFLYIMGKELLNRLFYVKFADCMGKPDSFGKRYQEAKEAQQLMCEIVASQECYTLKYLKINGTDLFNNNIPRQYIGKVLNMTLRQVIAEKLENKKSVLLKYALEYAKSIIS